MADLATQTIANTGTSVSFATNAALVDTAEVGTGTNTFVVYRNTDASAKTIVITVPGTTDYGSPLPDPEIEIPATTGEVWIPLRREYRAIDGGGRVTLSIKSPGTVTGLKVAVVRIS